jgi:hypothetical protein
MPAAIVDEMERSSNSSTIYFRFVERQSLLRKNKEPIAYTLRQTLSKLDLTSNNEKSGCYKLTDKKTQRS